MLFNVEALLFISLITNLIFAIDIKKIKIDMKSIHRKYSILFLIIMLLVVLPGMEGIAQCPMCRAAAASNLAHGGTEGKGLNTGILYMLSLPYLLIATLGFLWWKNKKEESKTNV